VIFGIGSNLKVLIMKYILVNWPKSQQFMEDNRCFQCIEIEGAVFVPEDVYDYYINGNVNAI
jgi:hypothetical protein